MIKKAFLGLSTPQINYETLPPQLPEAEKFLAVPTARATFGLSPFALDDISAGSCEMAEYWLYQGYPDKFR